MSRIATVAAAAAAVAFALSACQRPDDEPPPTPALRLSLNAPPGTTLGADDEPLDAAISPNQRELVFVATRQQRIASAQAPAGVSQLWRRRLAASDAEPIAGTEGARLPAWKQTGNVLSFFADGQLKLLNLKNGAVSVAAAAPMPAGATWLRDGSLLFAGTTGAVRRLVANRVSDATQLASGDTTHAFPVAVADGSDFVYVALRSDGERVIRLHSGGQARDVGTTAAHAAMPTPDWLLFVKDATLRASSVDAEGAIERRASPLALDVGTTANGRGLFVASADVLLHAPLLERPRRITLVDLTGALRGTIADVGDYWQVRVSPDGRRLAVTSRDPLLGSLDVLMIPVDGTSPALRLTTSVGADTDPVWLPDGRHLAFRTMRGQPEIRVTPAALTGDGDVSRRALPDGAGGEVASDWRRGEMLVQRRGSAGFDLVRVDEGTGATTVVADSGFNETDGRWSPDGHRVAYVSDEPGRPEIFVGRVPSSAGARDDGPGGTRPGDRHQRLSFGGGTHPRWTRDSRALLFLRGSTIMRADVVSRTRLGAPRPLFDLPGIRDFDVSPVSGGLVALLPVAVEPVGALSVTLNWRSLAEAERQQARPRTPPKF